MSCSSERIRRTRYTKKSFLSHAHARVCFCLRGGKRKRRACGVWCVCGLCVCVYVYVCICVCVSVCVPALSLNQAVQQCACALFICALCSDIPSAASCCCVPVYSSSHAYGHVYAQEIALWPNTRVVKCKSCPLNIFLQRSANLVNYPEASPG